MRLQEALRVTQRGLLNPQTRPRAQFRPYSPVHQPRLNDHAMVSGALTHAQMICYHINQRMSRKLRTLRTKTLQPQPHPIRYYDIRSAPQRPTTSHNFPQRQQPHTHRKGPLQYAILPAILFCLQTHTCVGMAYRPIPYVIDRLLYVRSRQPRALIAVPHVTLTTIYTALSWGIYLLSCTAIESLRS